MHHAFGLFFIFSMVWCLFHGPIPIISFGSLGDLIASLFSLLIGILAWVVGTAMMDRDLLKLLFTQSFIFLVAFALMVALSVARGIEISSCTSVTDCVYWTSVLVGHNLFIWMAIAMDALPNCTSNRWFTRGWLIFALSFSTGRFLSNCVGPDQLFDTFFQLSPAVASITLIARQNCLIGISWLILRSLVMVWKAPYSCVYIQGSLALNPFEMPDEGAHVARVRSEAVQKLQGLLDELIAAANAPPNHVWFVALYPLEYALPARRRPLVPLSVLRSFWDRPWFIWFMGFWLAAMIVWLRYVSDLSSQILLFVVAAIQIAVLAHTVDYAVCRVLMTRSGSAFNYAFLMLVSVCLLAFQIRETTVNTLQQKTSAATKGLTLKAQITANIMNNVFFFILAILANSVDAFVLPHWSKLVCLGLFCVLNGSNLYDYMFKWATDGSPSGCFFWGHYCNNVTVVINCNIIVLAFYLKYGLVMLFYHERLQTVKYTIARGMGAEDLLLLRLRTQKALDEMGVQELH
jgi:hypothetical protein